MLRNFDVKENEKVNEIFSFLHLTLTISRSWELDKLIGFYHFSYSVTCSTGRTGRNGPQVEVKHFLR